MIDADFVWGVGGTILYVVIVLLVLTYLARLFPEVAGLVGILAVALGLVAPGVGLALKLIDDL